MSDAGKTGRCLGLIGGLGTGATIHYYRQLVAAHEQDFVEGRGSDAQAEELRKIAHTFVIRDRAQSVLIARH